jgi:hypothetical protein
MRFIAIVAMGALALSACATPQPPLPEPPLPEPPLPWGRGVVDAAGCPREDGGLMLGTSPAIARQGTELTLHPMLYRGPMGPLDVPVACLSDVAVGPAGAATLSADRTRLTISPQAAPGAVVTARFHDEVGRHEIRVVGRDEVVLTGTWRQDRVKCDPGRTPGEPVRELRIDDKGTFGVTYQPFESYTDFWGDLTFEPSTGVVVMTRTGGNFTPQILDGEGVARLDGERRLVLEGVYLGDRNERNFEPRVDDKGQFVVNPDGSLIVDRPVCTYEFVR